MSAAPAPPSGACNSLRRRQRRRRRRPGTSTSASYSAGLMTAAASTTLLLLLLPLVQVTQAFFLTPPDADRRLIGGERKRIEDCRRRPPSFLGAGEGVVGALGSALADRQQASSSSSNSDSSNNPPSTTSSPSSPSTSSSSSSSLSSSSSSFSTKQALPPILASHSTTTSSPTVVLNQYGEDAAAEARFVAECEMPTDRGNFRMRSYRCGGIYAALEPVALTFGSLSGKENVLARIHDQCLTSEVFGSKRCDCKEQLGMALDMIKERGGVVIYLQQEGRGIGLANKVAAYALQDEGLDTVDANRHLGFGDDERTYDVVPSILRDLGVGSIQLMTNNPLKLDCLQKLGISVSKVVPIVVAPNAFNERYLITKAERMAHTLSPTLALPRTVVVPPSPPSSSSSSEGGLLTRKKTKAGSPKTKRRTTAEEGGKEGGQKQQAKVETAAVARAAVAAAAAGGGGAGGKWDYGLVEVKRALAHLNDGKAIVLVDRHVDPSSIYNSSSSSSNISSSVLGGDLVMLAGKASEEVVTMYLQSTSGIVFCLLPPERLAELWKGSGAAATAAGLDVKARITTGGRGAVAAAGGGRRSAAEGRAATLRALGKGGGREGGLSLSDFSTPGHIFVVSPGAAIGTAEDGAKTGLVRPSSINVRREWALELARLAKEEEGREGGREGGRDAAVAVAELIDQGTGEGLDVEGSEAFARRHGMVIISVQDLLRFVSEGGVEEGEEEVAGEEKGGR